MTIQARRLAVLAAISLSMWCASAAATLEPIDLPAAIRLALAQPGLRAAAHGAGDEYRRRGPAPAGHRRHRRHPVVDRLTLLILPALYVWAHGRRQHGVS
jgi:hypothetical protein